ncbi:low molecular weight protein-tyrosine-phosphatase [Salisediminibacterium beveridgei]
MAEAIARAKINEKGLEDKIHVGSSGTGNWHIGRRPHEGTLEILEKKGIDHANLSGSQTKSADFYEWDYFIAMDSSNEHHLINLKPDDSQAVIERLLSYHPSTGLSEVPDPYFTGNFIEVYDLIERSISKLIEEVIQLHVSS